MKLRTTIALVTGFVAGALTTLALIADVAVTRDRPEDAVASEPTEWNPPAVPGGDRSPPELGGDGVTFIGPSDPAVGTEKWYEMHAGQVIENNPGIVQDYVEGDELAQKTLLREFIEITGGVADEDTAASYIDRELFPDGDAG